MLALHHCPGCSYIAEFVTCLSYVDFSQSLIILGFISSLYFIISICLPMDVSYEYQIFSSLGAEVIWDVYKKRYEINLFSGFAGSFCLLKFVLCLSHYSSFQVLARTTCDLAWTQHFFSLVPGKGEWQCSRQEASLVAVSYLISHLPLTSSYSMLLLSLVWIPCSGIICVFGKLHL